MDRTNVIQGPAVVIYAGQTLYSEGDISVTPEINTFNVNTSAFGKADERLDNIVHTISFTPAGQWLSGHLPVLWPYQNPNINGSIYGAVDRDIVIHTLDGQLLTYKACAVTGMPSLTLSAVKQPMGSVTLRAIGENGTDWSDESKRVVIAAQAFADTSFDPTAIKTVPYTAAWGTSAPWNNIETEDGWTLDFEVSAEDKSCDSHGIFDARLTSVSVMAKCKPIGVSEAQVLTLLKVQGAGVSRGGSLSANAQDLVLTGGASGAPLVTVYNAAPKQAGFTFGSTTLRHGELGFVAVRAFAAGVPGPLFNVSTTA